MRGIPAGRDHTVTHVHNTTVKAAQYDVQR